jgi:predicted phosphoadenosine phosphosulfate sulfurtransferase
VAKRYLGIDVLTAAQQRISRVFDDFPVIYVSFSGGKDSGVLLELTAEEARRRGRRVGCLIVDLEAQYKLTVEEYIPAMLSRHADVLDVYWVCLPLSLRNAVSQIEPQWMCWEPGREADWVRPRPEHPGVIADEGFFPFYRRGMEFEDFVPEFGHWLGQGRMTACLVGIRTGESLNRWRTIASKTKSTHQGLQWTTWIKGGPTFNAYPIYDWVTEDIWTFYGAFKVPHNRLYELMFAAGLTIHQARICQPYGDDQKRGLWLYQIIEPETWGRVLARVSGAAAGARYAQDSGRITGRGKLQKPDHLSWEDYVTLLLESMPEPTAEHFRDNIAKFLSWYDSHGYPGGAIPDEHPTTKVGKDIPSWYRIAKMILSHDYWGKGLSIGPPRSTRAAQQLAAMRKQQAIEGKATR